MAMGQIPRSTENISSFTINFIVLYCIGVGHPSVCPCINS